MLCLINTKLRRRDNMAPEVAIGIWAIIMIILIYRS